jgi:hypothetical protein
MTGQLMLFIRIPSNDKQGHKPTHATRSVLPRTR